MDESQKTTTNPFGLASCQESFLPRKLESDQKTHTAEKGQASHASLDINRDALANGGVSVAVILSISFLVRSFALLISAVND